MNLNLNVREGRSELLIHQAKVGLLGSRKIQQTLKSLGRDISIHKENTFPSKDSYKV